MRNPVKVRNIPLASLFERTGADGRQYLVGRIANARIFIVPTERRSRGDRVWEAVIAEGPDATAAIALPDDRG
jgi:hypothetical protein